MTLSRVLVAAAALSFTALSSCMNSAGHGTFVGSDSSLGKPLANFPTVEERNQKIASEPSGNYYVGRRYFVDRTTFWGYVRRPRQPWTKATLVSINEDYKFQPDRLPETGPQSARYGHDQNFEYRLTGSFTGKKVYEPNSNQFLPEFKLTGYKLIDDNPGWLFSPKDRYDKKIITMPNFNSRY